MRCRQCPPGNKSEDLPRKTLSRILTSDRTQTGREAAGPQRDSERQVRGLAPREAMKHPPLVPAITSYDRSIEHVAREKATPTFN